MTPGCELFLGAACPLELLLLEAPRLAPGPALHLLPCSVFWAARGLGSRPLVSSLIHELTGAAPHVAPLCLVIALRGLE